jgi:hypothetical protein
MSERRINHETAHYCEACKKLGEYILATHSVTDAVQTLDGWQETAPRFGCARHRVSSNVTLIDGSVMPWETYRVN